MYHRSLPALVLSVFCMLKPAPAQDAAADARTLATALNQFAADLQRELAAHGSPTASPASIGIALAMLMPGARGTTADELAATLHLPADLRGGRLHAAFGKLLTDAGIAGTPAADKPVLRITNDLWLQQGFPVAVAYSQTLRASFAAGEHEVDFARDTEAARTTINRAIGKATNDRIPELIPSGTLTNDTRLVLTNAIWLKGSWLHQFAARGTKDAPFHLDDGTAVDVPTMHVTDGFEYAANDAWQCVALPFVGNTLRCEVVVPRDGKALADAERALLAGDHLKALAGTTVHVAMPRFKVAASHRLCERLQALGLRAAFDPRAADFTGITEHKPMFVGDVVHQTWINVDEAGAEAAAATAIVMRTGSARPQNMEQMKVDRPFAFVLRDVRTGLVLFFARVADPRTDAAKPPTGG